MRHWRESASRARRFAPMPRGRLMRRRDMMTFVWAGRGRYRGRAAVLAVQARVALTVNAWQPAPARRQRHRAGAGHPRWPMLKSTLVAASGQPVVRHEHQSRETVRTHLYRERVHSAITHRVLARLGWSTTTWRERRVTHGHTMFHAELARQVRAARSPHPGTLRTTQATVMRPSAISRLSVPRWIRVLRGGANRIAAAFPTRRTVHVVEPVHAGLRAKTVSAARPNRQVMADNRTLVRAVSPRGFAAQAQPLAATPARAIPGDPVPVERIERTLRESMTVVAERTVQRELERTLRAGSALNRRLRESIQAEMYDDVVFERERRGER
jgi:hypothetical protein